MSKNLDLDDRERNVIYIDAREYNKNKNTYSRGSGFEEYFESFKKSNKKFANLFKDYTKDNIVTNKNLPIGDFVHNEVCVEVKEANTGDLADSIRGKRLATQSHELFKLRDETLYKNPFKDCRIIVMVAKPGQRLDFEHISNSAHIYKGLLNFSGETPVNYVNYTKYSDKAQEFYGNPYEHLADSIIHLFGMNGKQIGRQSHVSMTKNFNPAVTYMLGIDTLSPQESDKLCTGEGLYSYADAFNFFREANDLQYTYSTLLKYTTSKKAKKTMQKVYGREAVKEAFA